MDEIERCFEAHGDDVALGVILGIVIAVALIVFVASGSQGGNKKL
jgi:hypothetical protein